MAFHGRFRDAEGIGDLPVGFARYHEPEDVAFPRAQIGVGSPVREPVRVVPASVAASHEASFNRPNSAHELFLSFRLISGGIRQADGFVLIPHPEYAETGRL
jgi:hypothetical protein